MADGAKITLHWLNGSRAQGILWLLEELQVPYELQIYHRLPSMMAPAELEKVHPLGKSPTITIELPGAKEPLVLAESAFIVQYFLDHFANGQPLQPKRWKNGQEGKLGGETEEWMRYQYIMYYSEGSFMTTAFLQFVLNGIKGPNVPFFIRPITKAIANQLSNVLVVPNMKKHLTLLEGYLETSPNGGKYLCGEHATGADIMLAYPLVGGVEAGMFDEFKWEKGLFKDTFPKLHAYIERLSQEPGWLRAAEKIKEIEGSFKIMP
ncbi:hypothetical protein GQ53DRAFT_782177 [Thozetella sp. PMI_491]|nr:hypothetical protein GQ53DRAFT_782177 [Thozetella sp. PMI_491]